MNNNDMIIIGGGLGGLTTGALLAKEGWQVTVLEKNHIVGGGLQNFSRHGIHFDTGMHILGGFRPGKTLHRICQHLGIEQKLRLQPVDSLCMDEIYYASDRTTYRVAEGKEGFVESFAKHFPHQRTQLQRYVTALYELASEIDLFNLRPTGDGIPQHSDRFLWSADQFIAHYIDDERLRDVLAYMNPMYGGVAGHTPAYVHALISVLYIDGTDRFAGGSQQLATALAEVIENAGGKVVPDAEVVRIAVDNRMVTAVQTKDGRTFSAPYYIAATHMGETLRIIDKGAFTPAYTKRLKAVDNTYSIFSIFVELKPQTFPYINHTCYYQHDYHHVWHLANYDREQWPYGMMYMTPPSAQQGEWATHLIVNCVMPFSAAAQWEDTLTGRRGKEYEAWKSWHEQRILARMEEVRPGFGQCVKSLWSASPLTVRDYYNAPAGAIYGFAKDCQNPLAAQVPVVTKVTNLLLTGQCVGLHGICGVPLSAITTAEALVGKNRIIEKLQAIGQ